mmetsp:Transcript_35140/g.100060  ORF Transcript_35140/g.100060 Transcript_35140/m.100060 type:complete len:156 (+) Transcript_35140:98-565(+)
MGQLIGVERDGATMRIVCQCGGSLRRPTRSQKASLLPRGEDGDSNLRRSVEILPVAEERFIDRLDGYGSDVQGNLTDFSDGDLASRPSIQRKSTGFLTLAKAEELAARNESTKIEAAEALSAPPKLPTRDTLPPSAKKLDEREGDRVKKICCVIT